MLAITLDHYCTQFSRFSWDVRSPFSWPTDRIGAYVILVHSSMFILCLLPFWICGGCWHRLSSDICWWLVWLHVWIVTRGGRTCRVPCRVPCRVLLSWVLSWLPSWILTRLRGHNHSISSRLVHHPWARLMLCSYAEVDDQPYTTIEATAKQCSKDGTPYSLLCTLICRTAAVLSGMATIAVVSGDRAASFRTFAILLARVVGCGTWSGSRSGTGAIICPSPPFSAR